MQFPNYSNSSYNVINTIVKYLGVKNNNETLEVLDNILKERKYKKIQAAGVLPAAFANKKIP